MQKEILVFSRVVILMLLLIQLAYAQTTEFTYQGKLNTAGSPANGNYDFEFLLFDALSGGTQLGSTVVANNVSVTDGVFSAPLNFGSSFQGASRFLEIRVRPSGQGGITILSPRQQVGSTPYSIRSLVAGSAESANSSTTALTANNALQLGGVTANQYVVTTDPRMSDARPPTPGSASYIQNGGTIQSGNFNISGSGQAGILSATTQYNLGGNRILVSPGPNFTNLFVGAFAGASNSDGNINAFFGTNAGFANTTGHSNSFFGYGAGRFNTTGNHNSFFGNFAGDQNTSAINNSFFGNHAGLTTTTGGANSFFGSEAGVANTVGALNSFFGGGSGRSNTTGSENVFFGSNSGQANTTGNSNAFFGNYSGSSNIDGTDNSFFGWQAGLSNTTGTRNSFFGSEAGRQNTFGAWNSFFGMRAGRANTGFENSFFGFQAGTANTSGAGNAFFGRDSGLFNVTGERNSFFGRAAGFANTTGGFNAFFGDLAGETNTTGSNNTAIGFSADVGSGALDYATAIGAGATAPTSNSITLGRAQGEDLVRIPGNLVVGTLSTGGVTSICRNAFSIIATCSSSARYKTNIDSFRPGLDLVRKLRPVSFNWKENGMLDVGLVAEELEKVEPLLTTTNEKGDVEGVKYDRVSVVLINAIKEQQSQIESLQKVTSKQKVQIESRDRLIQKQAERLDRQEAEIGALKNQICSETPRAELCRHKQ